MGNKQWIEFNINHYVKVKITETGIEELKKQYVRLKISGFRDEFKIPKVDENGYAEFQLHDLMHKFGHLIFGFDCPFETTIFFGLNRQ